MEINLDGPVSTGVFYNPLYLRGVELFNQRRFFECHEVWEELWVAELGAQRQFLKGLIQSAVALHHLTRGNRQGATKLQASSQQYLEPYRPRYCGLDVDEFVASISRCIHQTLAATEREVSDGAHPDLLPRLDLDPPPDTSKDEVRLNDAVDGRSQM
jgi:predicted metal-dependent hydrolase